MQRRDKIKQSTKGRGTRRPKARKAPIRGLPTADLQKQVADLARELKEAREHQIATGEILASLAESIPDAQPVFDAIVRNLQRLLGTRLAIVTVLKDGMIHLAAAVQGEFEKLSPYFPRPLDENTGIGRAMMSKQVLQFTPVLGNPAAPTVTQQFARDLDFNSVIYAPMIQSDQVVGVIATARREPTPFDKEQVAVIKAFADQAVIAIENTRLLNELRQSTDELSKSLQQQTATADVLRVISSSPGELKPVFDTMLANAMRICEAQFGNLFLYDGGGFTPAAWHNVPQGFIDFYGLGPYQAGPQTGLGRVASKKEIIHIKDITTEQAYLNGDPLRIATVELLKARTYLAVPMLKDEQLVGAIVIYRQEVRPFAEKQIELVKSFAAQAVIAIENTRLLSELRQSLEQQTATSEVLRVISSSATDLRPVFETIAHNSVHLCGATYGVVYRFDGEMINFVAHHNLDRAAIDALHQMFPMRLNTSSLVGRSILQRDVLHIADVAAEPNDTYTAIHQALGIRTFLAVPMLRDGNPIGAIALYRREVALFSDRQIELVKAFADQAVIAIENARLLSDLNKLNQQLEQRVVDQVSEIERMSRLRRFLPPQVADLIVASGTEKRLESHRREITALFCDLRGFTGFSERSDPEDVISLLREYHAAIGEIIIKYSGTLEHYAGDGVMVFFNDPIPVPNPALQAVQTALEMRTAIESLTEKWRRLGHELGFGVGIAHGFATLGTIGFEGRFDYAAIGTVSNVASRLCDEAKPGQILISPRVLMAVEDAVSVEPVGEFELKGISRPLAAYNVLSAVSPKI
jgi:class 3 adenylate cyclase/putative methionine-R-sulfoxide reductase with GAF domain